MLDEWYVFCTIILSDNIILHQAPQFHCPILLHVTQQLFFEMEVNSGCIVTRLQIQNNVSLILVDPQNISTR